MGGREEWKRDYQLYFVHQTQFLKGPTLLYLTHLLFKSNSRLSYQFYTRILSDHENLQLSRALVLPVT